MASAVTSVILFAETDTNSTDEWGGGGEGEAEKHRERRGPRTGEVSRQTLTEGREKPHKPWREEITPGLLCPLTAVEKKGASLRIRVKTNQMPL